MQVSINWIECHAQFLKTSVVEMSDHFNNSIAFSHFKLLIHSMVVINSCVLHLETFHMTVTLCVLALFGWQDTLTWDSLIVLIHLPNFKWWSIALNRIYTLYRYLPVKLTFFFFNEMCLLKMSQFHSFTFHLIRL